ncbi:LysR family transcriptional regulator [Novosphingobium sp. 9]|uniref:LysR family transcriptional regulator n=1 Tax=Novosphingobium sp. 9 TaxID=2025349 RepID=UPI0021B4DE47|nr:LysR family transcriptional regulator [Novosphingobium sp. 9]
MINPLWSRSLLALEKAGSFTRAAQALDLTQAAVSQHIRQLEDRFGAVVLRRSRALEWTPVGLALLDHARELEAAELRLAARLVGQDVLAGDVEVVTPGSVGLLLNPLLLDLQEREPGLVIRHRFAPDAGVVEDVAANRADFGIASIRPDDPRLAATPFLEEPLELIVPVNEVAESWEDLRRIGMIDHPDGKAMATRLLSRRFGGNPGVRHLPVRGFSNQVGLILEPVARGLGFTVLPRYARQAFAKQDRICVVECGTPVVDTLWLLHRAEWPLPARARHVVEHLRRSLGLPTDMAL